MRLHLLAHSCIRPTAEQGHEQPRAIQQTQDLELRIDLDTWDLLGDSWSVRGCQRALLESANLSSLSGIIWPFKPRQGIVIDCNAF